MTGILIVDIILTTMVVGFGLSFLLFVAKFAIAFSDELKKGKK